VLKIINVLQICSK